MDLLYTTHWLGIFYFDFCYFRKVKLIMRLYKKLSDFKTFGIPTNFHESTKIIEKYSRFHNIYIILVIIGFSLVPLAEAKQCEKLKKQNNISEICGIMGTVWFPFNIDFFPVKQLFVAYQILCSYFLVGSASFISFSIAETAEHVIIRLKHLKIVFLEALKEKNHKIRLQKFGFAVQYHNALLGYVVFVVYIAAHAL